jgi:hypothetical protein
MSKYLYVIVCYLFITSCYQNTSQAEKDYIRNLEEKNRALEKELQEMKNETNLNCKSQVAKQRTENYKDYFIIGSTENEVIEVMGEPTSYIRTAPEARKFYYGLSTVYFYNGKVISYDNLQENLKVKVK